MSKSAADLLWYSTTTITPPQTVSTQDPVPTGGLASDGKPIVRLPVPAGFLRFDPIYARVKA